MRGRSAIYSYTYIIIIITFSCSLEFDRNQLHYWEWFSSFKFLLKFLLRPVATRPVSFLFVNVISIVKGWEIEMKIVPSRDTNHFFYTPRWTETMLTA